MVASASNPTHIRKKPINAHAHVHEHEHEAVTRPKEKFMRDLRTEIMLFFFLFF
jgi:hypothetical protein